MTVDVNVKLAQFLREGQNWEKRATNVQYTIHTRTS